MQKKYLTTFISVCFSLLIVLLLVELCLNSISTPYRDKYSYLKSRTNNINTLLLGNSYIYFGLNPIYFSQPTFNAANVSQDYKYDYHILDTATDNQSSLRFVVLPVSIFNIYSDIDSGVEFWRKFNYRIYMKYGDIPFSELFELGNYSILFASQNRLELFQKLYYAFSGNNNARKWTESGWGVDYLSTADSIQLEESGKIAAKRHQLNSVPSSVSVKNLDKIVKSCLTKGIKVVLVVPPAYSTYRNHISEEKLMYLESTLSKYATVSNVKVISLFSDNRFISTDFHDGDHLNHIGAEKFSKIINNAIMNW